MNNGGVETSPTNLAGGAYSCQFIDYTREVEQGGIIAVEFIARARHIFGKSLTIPDTKLAPSNTTDIFEALRSNDDEYLKLFVDYLLYCQRDYRSRRVFRQRLLNEIIVMHNICTTGILANSSHATQLLDEFNTGSFKISQKDRLTTQEYSLNGKLLLVAIGNEVEKIISTKTSLPEAIARTILYANSYAAVCLPGQK